MQRALVSGLLSMETLCMYTTRACLCHHVWGRVVSEEDDFWELFSLPPVWDVKTEHRSLGLGSKPLTY